MKSKPTNHQNLIRALDAAASTCRRLHALLCEMPAAEIDVFVCGDLGSEAQRCADNVHRSIGCARLRLMASQSAAREKAQAVQRRSRRRLKTRGANGHALHREMVGKRTVRLRSHLRSRKAGA